MKYTRKGIGVTYPTINGWLPEWFYRIWKKYCCSKGWHLFDECYGACRHMTAYECAQNNDCDGYMHSLYCDACELDIEIKD
jgi:hypothetical protein